MPPILLVALGSAVGGVSRWSLVLLCQAQGFSAVSGTFLVNVLGGFLIGACVPWMGSDAVRLGLMTGVMGGFTTFSAYSLQTLQLIQDGRWGTAAGYALGSVAACLVACWLGWFAATRFSAAP